MTDDPLPVTTESPDLVSLDRIGVGRCGMVAHVDADDAEIRQLKAMGVCVGRKVMLARAGDPMILRVLGSRIGVSARLASRVRVVHCAGDYFGGLGE